MKIKYFYKKMNRNNFYTYYIMCGCNKKIRQKLLNIQKQRRQFMDKTNEIVLHETEYKEKNNDSNNSFRLLNSKLSYSSNLKSRPSLT